MVKRKVTTQPTETADGQVVYLEESFNWTGLILGGFVLLLMAAAVTAVVWFVISGLTSPREGSDTDGHDRRVSIDEELYEEALDIMDTRDGIFTGDAVYLSRVFSGVRDRLMVDGEREAPVFDTLGELNELGYHLGLFATENNEIGERYDLEELIQYSLFEHVFGEEPDDGEISSRQMKDFLERLDDFAAVFNKIAEEN